MLNHSYKSVSLLITAYYPFHELFANSVSWILFANVLVSELASGSRVKLEASSDRNCLQPRKTEHRSKIRLCGKSFGFVGSRG